MYFIHKSPRDTDTYIYKNGSEILMFTECEDNIDYQKYLEWLSEGNTPEIWNPEVLD